MVVQLLTRYQPIATGHSHKTYSNPYETDNHEEYSFRQTDRPRLTHLPGSQDNDPSLCDYWTEVHADFRQHDRPTPHDHSLNPLAPGGEFKTNKKDLLKIGYRFSLTSFENGWVPKSTFTVTGFWSKLKTYLTE